MAVLILQSFNSMLLMGDYYLHTDRYMELCENKAMPMMHCNGQCILAKKMKKQAEQEKNNPERRMEKQADVYYAEPQYLFTPPIATSVERQDFPIVGGTSTTDRPHFVFRPPIA